ncbi:ABC transporter permease [Paenibacillus pini]|uniref:Alkanesulfonates transport system permease protein n=1 Tax=Paenibacillus pini JCM 16418 TaxID=1236976 RepID=W7Y6T8_9BACL|nr:ABC transporter permease [Paenibacillus pini]GAF06630.1 alkanesulfonates transport system permease protein [Paenibacillus pini JCM 16418]
MSDGIEAIINTNTAVREVRNNIETAPVVTPTVKKASVHTAWKSLLSDLGLGAVIPVVTIVIWQLAGNSGLISAEFLPTPLTILNALVDLTVSGEILHHLSVSMGRAGIGFLIGGILGLLFGLLTGLFRSAEYLVDPSVQVLRIVPHLAIAPLIILWFGFGEVSKIVIIISGSFFPLYINTFMGIRNVENKLFEVARVLGFSPYQRLRKLILPAALPSILLGLRLSLAVAWIGLVVAEMIGSQSGIGFLINEAKQNTNTPVIFVGIIIFAIVGKLIDSLFRIIERKFLFWRDSYQG